MPNNPLQITDSPDAHDPLYLCEVNGFTHEQALADARLIAAAPDLLAALDRIANMINAPHFSTARKYAIRDAARAAIAKATGADK